MLTQTKPITINKDLDLKDCFQLGKGWHERPNLLFVNMLPPFYCSQAMLTQTTLLLFTRTWT